MTKTITPYLLLTRVAQAAILLFAPALASASSFVLIPSRTTVTAGDSFTVDLFASDLQLGGFDVTFGYNPLLGQIDLDNLAFDTYLGGPDNSFAFWFADLDTLETAELSFVTSADELAALQSLENYPLVHIPFQALQPGTLVLDFVASPFSGGTDYAGLPIGGVTYQGTSITILAPAAPPPDDPPPSGVPEPGPAVLVLTGAGLVGISRLIRRTN